MNNPDIFKILCIYIISRLHCYHYRDVNFVVIAVVDDIVIIIIIINIINLHKTTNVCTTYDTNTTEYIVFE